MNSQILPLVSRKFNLNLSKCKILIKSKKIHYRDPSKYKR